MAYQMKPSAGVPEVVVEDAAGRVFEDQGSADPGLWFGVPGREIGAAGAARLDWPFQDFGSCGLGHLQDGGLSARARRTISRRSATMRRTWVDHPYGRPTDGGP